VLREADLRRLLIATAIASLGSGMSAVVITFTVLDTLHSAADLGIVLASGEVPFVVFLLFGGVLADRVSRRLLMMLGCAAVGAVWLTLALLMLLSRVDLEVLAASNAAVGVISAIATPTMAGLLPQTVSPERLGDANALRGITQAATGIAGPGFGGVLIAALSPGIAVLAMAGCYVSAAGVIALLRAGRDPGETDSGIMAQLRTGWAEFRSRPWLAGSVAGISLWHMVVYAPFMIAGAVIVKESLGGAAAWSAIQVCLSAGTLLGGFAALHMHPKRPVLSMMWATAVFSWPLFVLGIRAPLAVVCVACLVSGVMVALANVWWDVTVQAKLPNEVLGRISSYDYIGTTALLPVGYLLAAPLAAIAGPAPVLIAGGVAGLIIPFSICALPSVRTLTASRLNEPPLTEVPELCPPPYPR
jgi:MFS family permease